MAKRSDETLYGLPEVQANDTKQMAVLSKISTLDPQTMDMRTLLAEGHTLKVVEARLKAVKKRITELVQANGLVSEIDGSLGARCGSLCSVVRWSDGRESIKRELLIENGVTPAQIEASITRGEGYWVCELPEISDGE